MPRRPFALFLMPDLLIEDNVLMIEQGVRLLERISADLFTSSSPSTLGASIGGHLRHNLDHYACFQRGMLRGRIDYDDRERASDIETKPAAAIQALQRAAGKMRALADENLDRSLEVRMDTGESDERPWTHSSARRELQFLLSHTVHHYALIAMVCRLYGQEVDDDFGVAPSTLKHRRRSDAACAR